MSEENNPANDYAVAKHLNERVWKILWYVADLYPFYGSDLDKINRNYILLVQELVEIYARNKELQSIEPKPEWRQYKHIEGYEPQIADLQDDRTGDTGQNHTAAVKRLCIIAGKEEPTLTKRQKDLVVEADEIIATLTKEVDKEKARTKALAQQRQDWIIPEYTLTYDDMRGVIKINGVYQLNKRSTNDGSNIDKLLKQALAQPNEAFTPELNNTKKNLSTILSNVGFDTTLRQLFFPTARKGKGIHCRPKVTRAEADAEHIDTASLDLLLKEAGAITKPVSPF